MSAVIVQMIKKLSREYKLIWERMEGNQKTQTLVGHWEPKGKGEWYDGFLVGQWEREGEGDVACLCSALSYQERSQETCENMVFEQAINSDGHEDLGPLNETNAHEDPGPSSELAWHLGALYVLLSLQLDLHKASFKIYYHSNFIQTFRE